MVRRTPNAVIRLKDIGRVIRAQRDREMMTRADGEESVQIDIYKEADANMVEVAKKIKTTIRGLCAESRR